MNITQIQNQAGKCVSEGRNLAVLYTNARRRGGVVEIIIRKISDSKTWSALVVVRFSDGYRGVTNFADHGIACRWADRLSARRGTCWTGCRVDHAG